MEMEYRLRKIIQDHYNGFNIGLSYEPQENRISLNWLIDDRCSRYDDYTACSSRVPIDYMNQESNNDEVVKLIDKGVVMLKQSAEQHMSGVSGIGINSK
jgi:hypothetical protein